LDAPDLAPLAIRKYRHATRSFGENHAVVRQEIYPSGSVQILQDRLRLKVQRRATSLDCIRSITSVQADAHDYY